MINYCSYCFKSFDENYHRFSVIKDDAGNDMTFCAECLKELLFNQENSEIDNNKKFRKVKIPKVALTSGTPLKVIKKAVKKILKKREKND